MLYFLFILLTLFRAVLRFTLLSMIAPVRVTKELLGRWAARAAQRRHLSRLNTMLSTTENYGVWCATARRVDALHGYAEWAEKTEHIYDVTEIERRLLLLQPLREAGDTKAMAFHLRAILSRLSSGLSNKRLFRYYTGTKKALEDYENEIVEQLGCILNCPDLSVSEKYNFFRDTYHSYGKTALILSGGVPGGLHHVGAIKALHDAGVLPRVVAASGAGAVIASLLCTQSQDELSSDFFNGLTLNLSAFADCRPHSFGFVRSCWQSLFTRGYCFEGTVMRQFLEDNLGDLTFEEAYQRTLRVLNLSVIQGGRATLLNHMTHPNVLVRSAAYVALSSSSPRWFAPSPLLCLDSAGKVREMQLVGCDPGGAIVAGFPIKRMRELFNTGFLIVSQVDLPLTAFLCWRPGHELKPILRMQHSRSTSNRVRSAIIHLTESFIIGMRGFIGRMQECGVGVSLHALGRFSRSNPRGDVTLLPMQTLEQVLAVFDGLSGNAIAACTSMGCRNVWPQTAQVRFHTRIECMLFESLRSLRSRNRAAPAVVLTSARCSVEELAAMCQPDHGATLPGTPPLTLVDTFEEVASPSALQTQEALRAWCNGPPSPPLLHDREPRIVQFCTPETVSFSAPEGRIDGRDAPSVALLRATAAPHFAMPMHSVSAKSQTLNGKTVGNTRGQLIRPFVGRTHHNGLRVAPNAHNIFVTQFETSNGGSSPGTNTGHGISPKRSGGGRNRRQRRYHNTPVAANRESFVNLAGLEAAD